MVDCDKFDYRDIESINYENEIDFNADLEELDTKTKSLRVDWKIREEALKKLAGICIGNRMKNENFLKYFNEKYYKNIYIQFKEKRSIIIREASRILSFCVKILGFYIEKAIINIISQPYIFLIIEKNENKVSVGYATLCILNIVRYLKSEKIIDIICSKINNKSDGIRILCSQSILIIMKEYQVFVINEKINIFFDIFHKFLKDVCGEVKSNSRKAFFYFREKCPNEVGIFFNSLDKKLQKEILDEEKQSKNIFFYKNQKQISVNNNNNLKNYNDNNDIYNENDLIYSISYKNSNNKTINNNNIYNIYNKINGNNLMHQISYKNNHRTINNNNVANVDNINNGNNAHNNLIRNMLLRSTRLSSGVSKVNVSAKKPSANKLQLEKLNKKLVQLNIIAGNEDEPKKNPDNISDKILKELEKLNLVKAEELTKNEKNIDQSILDGNYLLIEEKLLMYLHKLDKCTTSKNKLVIFKYIYNEFELFLRGLDKISKLTLRKFVDDHIKNLIDVDQQLVEQIIKNLMRMAYYMSKIFKSYDVESIVKILMTHITSGNKQICTVSKELLKIIKQKFDNEEIFKALYDVIKEGDNEMCDIGYQYLYYIIPNCHLFFKDYNNFKKLFKLICISDKINFKSIGNVIKYIHKHFKEEFDMAFQEENKDNQNNLINIMDKSKCPFIRHFKEKYNELRQKELEEEIKITENEQVVKIGEVEYGDPLPELDDLPFEISNSLRIGDINLFIEFIEKNNEYIPDFLLLLSNSKYNGSIYTKNLINFTYALLMNKNCLIKLNSCVELFTHQAIHLFLTNTQDKNAIICLKDILNVIPFKLDSKKFLKSISTYLNNDTDIVLLQSLLISLKNFITNIEHNNLEEYLPFFIDQLLNLFNHNLEEIRRHAVICCAEIYTVLGYKFDSYISKLPKNQQNWIHIFVKK